MSISTVSTIFIDGTEYVKIEDAHKCKGGFVIEVEEVPGYYIRVSPMTAEEIAELERDWKEECARHEEDILDSLFDDEPEIIDF